MSRSSNSLKTSDVVVAPIKLKYSSSYDSTTYSSASIRVLAGINNEITTEGSVAQPTLNYRSVRHLYYSNYLTGSFPVSASAAFNWEQSTAASGTLDADLRYFPTGSGDKVKILSIPRNVFGEKISRRGFELVASDGVTYRIVDDGNGNLIDITSDTLYVDRDFFTPNESFLASSYTYGPPKNTHVGNIIYAQGIIIITNPDYYDILDAGPFITNKIFTFYTSDNPKQFNPLIGTTADSTPIVSSSLQLEPIPGEVFPAYTLSNNSVTLSAVDPLYTAPGSYTIDYSLSSTSGARSTANIIVNIVDSPFPVSLTYDMVLSDSYFEIIRSRPGTSNLTIFIGRSMVNTLTPPDIEAGDTFTVNNPASPTTAYRQVVILDTTYPTNNVVIYNSGLIQDSSQVNHSWTIQPGRSYYTFSISTNVVEDYLQYVQALNDRYGI